MKIGIFVLFLANCYLFQTCSGILCGSSCSNRLSNIICLTQFGRCQRSSIVMDLLCPQTCRTISRSIGINAKTTTTKCEMDCKDKMASITCQILKNQYGCRTIGISCRLTCGKCTKCQTPPPPCTNDCKDENRDCPKWKKKGYCKTSSKYYSYMENECPLSCGICKLCPVLTPKNTALPPPSPTPRACLPSGQACQTCECIWMAIKNFSSNKLASGRNRDTKQGCQDKKEHCEHWAGIGHCNKTGKFPYVLEVCPKSCKICTPCPKLLPPPPPTTPPCSADCQNTNGECEFWKSQDYCNSASKHYDFVKETCPVSCGVCKPCTVN